MSMGFIILLPVLVGFGLLYWSSMLDGEDFDVLKLLFRLLFIPLVFLSINFAVIDASLTYASDSALVAMLGSFSEYLGYLFMLVGLYFIYLLAKGILNNIVENKRRREEDRHEG